MHPSPCTKPAEQRSPLPADLKGAMHVSSMDLLALTYEQLVCEFQQRYDRGAFHATALYRAFYNTTGMDLDAIPAFDASFRLKRRVQRDLRTTSLPSVVDRQGQEGVTKLVFELTDGCRVEAVIIPMANHVTLCISSQVGCRMGCRFCETGQMGWCRNLRAEEIVGQVYAVKVAMGLDVRNVVLMGMGEPLDNFDAVTQAIRVLSDQRGLDIAMRRITLSTAGLVDGIERLGALNWPQLKLAISLNASNDAIRGAIMPVNHENTMDRLKKILFNYPRARGTTFFVEYVLIKGVNDADRYAKELAEYLNGLDAKVNLIPYNPRRFSPFEAPDEDDIHRFHNALMEQQLFVRIRRSKGAAIRAACGQLGAQVNNLGSFPNELEKIHY